MKLTFIGLGVMGYPMAGHLQNAGHDVCVYNRTTAKAQKWADDLGRRGCAMEHSSDSQYGENIFWSSGMNPTAADVTNDWAAEIKYYKKGTKLSGSNYSKF